MFPAPLKLEAMAFHRPEIAKARILHPFGSDFYLDLLKEFHGQVEPAPGVNRPSHTFEELSEGVLKSLKDQGQLDGIDLMILTYDLPNCVAYNSTTSYLSHRFGIDCHMFAISDLGSAATLTAMDFVSKFFSSGKYKRALVITVDQGLLPTVSSETEALEDAASAYILTAGEGAGISLVGYWRQRDDLPLHNLLERADASSDSLEIAVSPSVEAEQDSFLRIPAKHRVCGPMAELQRWMTSDSDTLWIVDRSVGFYHLAAFRKDSGSGK